MNAVTLRPQKKSDTPDLAELFNQPRVIDGTLRLPFTPEDGVGEWLESMGPRKRMIIADCDQRAVGFVVLSRLEGRMAHIGEVFIAVHDSFQQRGIATALLSAAIDVADNWMGLVRLQLEVLVDNAPAIRLYERTGFVREGRARAGTLRNGALVDHYYMARLATPPKRRAEDQEENP